MADLENISHVLEKSLQPASAKEAEVILKTMEIEPGFAVSLLHIVSNNNVNMNIRLAGALYFKNLIKRKWIDENGNYQLNETDIRLIKKEIIGLMVILPDSLQIQIGESISLIAESEFPELWSELIDELVSKLTLEDLNINKNVLKVAHSIFKRWRPLFRSDELFLEIKLVLDKFSVPFLEMLKQVDLLIESNLNNKDQLKLLLENLSLLIKIYYDLNCQDIPEFFEDNLATGFNILLKYLKFSNKLIEDDDEDEEMDLIIHNKIGIIELIQLYTTRYEDEFKKFIKISIEIIWDLLNNVSKQSKNDILVSKSLQFMTSISTLSKYNTIFISDETTIKSIIEKIVLPNIELRDIDIELFEDDPIEFIRRDLEGSDVDSRRRSTTDFLRGLKEINENLITNILMNYINFYLTKFNENPEANWKFKDISIYLFTSIASKGSITNAGITSTNLLIDIIKFFNEFIYPDLVNQISNPILKVDSIKFIYIFRNQLTKEQLVEILSLLSNNFNDNNYVVFTYTAITIEKILSLKDTTTANSALLFNKTDLTNETCNLLLNNLFQLIFKIGLTPEKLSENEFLMKCIMRILLIKKDTFPHEFNMLILHELIKIIEIILKNPSNPKFNHYSFESICILLKFNLSFVKEFYESLKVLLINKVLGEDIQEFIPYSFQILAYILENYPNNEPIPIEYEQLVKPLCLPSIWEFRGNIPAIKRLLGSIIKAKPQIFHSREEILPILGIYQRLILSKNNFNLGFDFLETVLFYINHNFISEFLNEIFLILLNRLKAMNKNEKFVKRFIVFLNKFFCINNEEWNSVKIIAIFNNIQNGLFEQILNSIILNNLNKFNNLTDKKILIIGSINLICDNYNNFSVSTLLNDILKLVNIDSYPTLNEDYELLIEIENEDFTFGSSFNRLNIIAEKGFNPITQFNNKNSIDDYVKQRLSQIDSNTMAGLVNQLDDESKAILSSL